MRCQSRGLPCPHRSLFALAPAEIAIQREAGDGERLTLGTGLFHPIVDSTRDVPAVADLRDDALKARLAGVLVHLAAIDPEALAELDIGLGDDFLEQGLTFEQRQLPQIVAVEVKQIERDHHDLFGSSLEFVLQHREVRGAVPGTTTSPSMIADPALMFQASAAIFLKRLGEHLDGGVPEMDLNPV